MHDTPQPSDDTTNPDQVAPESLIAELATGDPAAGPDIADEIAARLEADLAGASRTVYQAEATPDAD